MGHIYCDDIDEKIVEFIQEHHVLTLATSSNNKPYTCSCFYVYHRSKNKLIFTSDIDTRHISEVKENNSIAGNIVLETTQVGKIRGLQFTGTITNAKGKDFIECKLLFLKKFPYAILKNTALWIVEPDFMKFTDNRLGFGKKMIWDSSKKPKTL